MAQIAKEPERVHVGVYVDVEQRDRLHQLATENERSVSAELRRAVRDHLERERQEHAAA